MNGIRDRLSLEGLASSAPPTSALFDPRSYARAALTLGIVVLVGSATGLKPLTTFLAGEPPMPASAALALVMLSAAILLRLSGRYRRLGTVLILVVLALVAATGIEFALRIDLGIDRLLAADVVEPGAPYPGRMATSAALAFATASAALLLRGTIWRGAHLTEWLAFVVGSIGALGFLGHVYGAQVLTSIGSNTDLTFPASIGFILLAAGLAGSDPDHLVSRLIGDPGPSGAIARRLTTMILIVLPASGAVAIYLERSGAVASSGATAIVVVLDMVVFVVAGSWAIDTTRRLEESVRASTRAFQDALDDVSLVAVMLDTSATITFANRYLLELSGWTASEVIGKDWYELFHPDSDRDAARAAFHALLDTGRADRFWVGQIVLRDGRERDVEWSSAVLRDATGATIGLAGIGADITERAEAREALAASERRLRTALDAMLDGVSILTAVRDPEGRIIDFRIEYANPAVTGIGRMTVEQQIGGSILELLPGHRVSGLFDAYVRVTETGAPFESASLHYVDPDAQGGPIDQYVEQRVARLGDGVVVSVRDVTSREAAELERRRLATAIEQSFASIVITDTTGAIEYVNPAFEQSSGYSRDEVIGKNPRILKSGVQDAAFYAAMWSTLTSGSPFVSDVVNRRKDGSLYQEESVVSPIHDDAGVITSYVAVKRDVTAQRATEAAQARLARERSLIAGTISQLAPGPTPEATAELICQQVVSLEHVVTADIGYFSPSGQLVSLGFARADAGPVELRRIPFQRSRALFEQTAAGPWVEDWVHRPWHPYEKLFAELDVTSVAHLPVRLGEELVGMINATAAEVDGTGRLTESLPALLEFAGIAGVILGPAIKDMTEVGRGRERVSFIIRARAFQPVFQPIVDLKTGAHVGFEALTRFTTGSAPDVVFAEARDAGLEHDLEIATLAAAIEAAHELPANSWLSLNVSPGLVLADTRLPAVLRLADRDVVLEVTEHVPIADYRGLTAAINRLRPNVRVAVDDAGSGVANFHHIVELRPAFLKLDISMIRGIDGDLTRQALVMGLQEFGGRSGSRSIAEGIEDEAELAVLRDLGVPFGQGYLLGRPAPIATWTEATESDIEGNAPGR